MKFDLLNEYIIEAVQNYNPDEIIEITSFEQLMEMSSVGGGAMQGYGAPFGDPKTIKKFNKKQAKEQRLKGKRLSEASFSQYNPNPGTQIPSLTGAATGKGPDGQPKTWLPVDVVSKFNKKEAELQFQKIKNSKNKITEEEINMFKREDILVERKVRKYIRNKIKNLIHEQKKAEMQQEMQLRQVIRQLIKEGDISDIHPHRSTGINILEDLLKKMIPTLRTDFKRLTTDKTQRDSFRAHLVKAIKDSLMPMMVNDKYRPEDEEASAPPPADAGPLLSEPPVEEPEAEPEEAPIEEPAGDEDEEALANLEEMVMAELESMNEIDIEVQDGDEEKKVPIEDDDTPSDEEVFGTGLEGLDETGRNMAFTCFKKVSQYILDAYDSLANPKDKEIFIDYLITNVKLYFDKFEDEIAKTVDEPTTSQYDDAKA